MINTINLGTAPNDGNGSGPRTAGGIINGNFTDTDNAASRLIGIGVNEIPDSSQGFHAGNLSPSVFLSASGDFCATGYIADGSSTAILTKDIQGVAQPTSITVVGTFGVFDEAGAPLIASIAPTLSPSSSSNMLVMVVTGIASTTGARIVTLRGELSTSEITVNS